jgi:anhydro-N-acetylmuramic acid kinase
MNHLEELIYKREKKVIGLLSGTSVDAIDAVLITISDNGLNTKVKVMDFISLPIEESLREFILKCSSKKESNTEDICKLNFILGHHFADAVKKILKKNKLSSKDIDLIGSHGQTIYHIPESEDLYGCKTKSTFQVGDPSVIANLTGITTVGDFRNADVAVNGDGAPLISYLDYILFNRSELSRVLLNIGGIANITYLPGGCSKDEVVAFDTGPGNILIDNLMRKLFQKDFDDNGNIALSGKFNKEVFSFLCKEDQYYQMKPPKSTGREYYGDDFVHKILDTFNNINHEDILRTVTEFTSYAISYNVKKFTTAHETNVELIVSGGGAKNPCMMNSLRSYLKDIKVTELKENGLTADNKEAVLFAVLANETVCGNPSNIKSVTGAKREVLLGKICIA